MTLVFGILIGFGLLLLGIPIIKSLGETICSWFEVLKAQAALRVARVNVEVEKMAQELESMNESTNVIGYSMPDERISFDLDDDDDDEDDDDDLDSANKSSVAPTKMRKIGFDCEERL